MTYRSDKTAGPTAGTATVDPLEFLARVVTHTPNPGQVMQRSYGWYASRTRGARRQQGLAAAGPAEGVTVVTVVEPVAWSLRAARARWAEWLRRIFEVDPLTCPRCQGVMRVVAVITDATVIGRILAHRVRARDPTAQRRSPLRLRRRPPSTRARSLTPRNP